MTQLPRDPGSGLTLRAATAADADALAAFNADVIRMQDMPEPQANLGEWTRDLVEGRHPTARASDAVIVEDTRTRAIVSSMFLLSQTWLYGGVRIPVGQPELVGTRADFRGRGLVRMQFDVLHERSDGRGDVMQAISGVPWFYRQFGYEMALPRGGGSRVSVRELASMGTMETFDVRPATEDDAPFLAALDAAAATRHAVWVPRDADQWRYELTGHREGSAAAHDIDVIERGDGTRVGGIVRDRRLFSSGTLGVAWLEVAAGTSWRAASVAALRSVRTAGDAAAARAGRAFEGVSLWFLGLQHPVAEIFRLSAVDPWDWYALYTRVADVATFLRAVTPALEERLARSLVAGHTADLRLGFYRDGVRLVVEKGRIKAVERWQPSRTVVGQENGWGTTDPGRPHALFPDLTFLQLLFGLRSLDDLTGWYPDCVVRGGESRALLNALFPRQHSIVWPVL